MFIDTAKYEYILKPQQLEYRNVFSFYAPYLKGILTKQFYNKNDINKTIENATFTDS